MQPPYTALEPTILNGLGIRPPSLSVSDASFYATSTFVYGLFFVGILLAAFYGYTLAGIWRMQASQESITKSNEKFKKVTLGLLGVFSLFLIIFTVNKDLLIGDVGLGALQAQRGGVVAIAPGASAVNSGNSSRACEASEAVIAKARSTQGVCGGTTCRILTGCNYEQYRSIIERESQAAGVNPKLIIVTMCKESGARVNPPENKNPNPNGTYDCGLMQINQPGPCTENILDPTENIKRGVALMKQKLSFATQVYPSIPTEAGAFASYNCCANGTIPHAPSEDCTVAAGFPFALPKWACPLNPGEGVYNMCTVKNYTCELSACLKSLP